MKVKMNEYLRICIFIIIIAIIGISYTIYYAFMNNNQVVYQNYGINQVININPTLTFFQILIIIILGLGFIGAIVYLKYTNFGMIRPEKIIVNEEKFIFYVLETILLTIILTLIIVIPTNILLEKYNSNNDYQSNVSCENNIGGNNKINYYSTKYIQ